MPWGSTNPDISRVRDVHRQGIRGAAVRLYRKPLITPPMGISGAPVGWNFFCLFGKQRRLQTVTEKSSLE